ncbi:MAG: DUF3347 domain-containing protein [Phycisphaerales bacterium]|nr:DUF3347 domain-containing protein [Phycisphaerales bacterium]
MPADAKYACPMATHPDAAKADERGPYFAAEPGECPRCGMKLKPIEELAWAKAMLSADGGEVAYSCPHHPAVFSKIAGECPRCGMALEPFKVMYTCPDPKHAQVIQAEPGMCPLDGRTLVPFRGVWLSADMAAKNAPPDPDVAKADPYHCPKHPLVHSAKPGRCPICAAELVADQPADGAKPEEHADAAPGIPPGAKYVCPMQICDYFSAEPGDCPYCGMKIRLIERVPWAKALLTKEESPKNAYVCPMHPQEHSDQPGTCAICGMQLVARADLPEPKTAPEAVRVQMNHLMEHYLGIQERLAGDRVEGVAKQALGLIAAADEIEKHLADPQVDLPDAFKPALQKLRDAAVKLRAEDLAESRVAFVELSGALRTLVEQARPDRDRYEKIYIFHCPMSKGDWLQTTPDKRNPYYGFQMLTCGELEETR